MKKITLQLCLLFLTVLSSAQDIELTNPSFEDAPHIGMKGGRGPIGWFDCGAPGETAPDVQPSPQEYESFFGVNQEAFHGETYLGMVARDNDSYESVGQRLREPLKAGVTYQFKVRLAKSKEYKSISRKTKKPVDYTRAIVLRIWGGTGPCGKKQMLGETDKIDHLEWVDYTFTFIPKQDWDNFVIEAFWETPVMFAYNGNILVDDCSKLYELDSLSASKVVPGVVSTANAAYAAVDGVSTEGAGIKAVKTEGKAIKSSDPRTKLRNVRNTATRKPLTMLDTARLSPAFIKSKLNICQENNIDVNEKGYRLMKVLFLKRVFELEEMSLNGRIKNYVSTHSIKELGLAVRTLKKIGANKMAGHLNELKNIQAKELAKEPLDTNETALLKNAASLFKSNAKEENISELILKYIQENDKAIRKDLSYCHQ